MNLKATETMRRTAGTVDGVAALLGDLIDYAGLFPPASLAMTPAVVNYGTYLQSEYSWILGRFIVPVSRLGEFENAIDQVQAARPETGSVWELSVLPGADVPADLDRVRKFNDRFAASHFSAKVEIRSVEVKIATVQEIDRLSEIIPEELEAYFEIPLSGNERDCIAAVADRGRRAKIRTGGETADKFPAPESVIEFIRLCAAASVSFKATAGLHHPFRSVHRLTYQPDSPSGIMHGFLNVFLAAAFLRAGMATSLALGLLEEQSVQAFHFDSQGIRWQEHWLKVSEIAAARRTLAVSFGSCSFTEPIDDLRALRLL
jgi:hypothetical protein